MKNVWSIHELRWTLRRPWELPCYFFKNIQYSFQRIVKGYCNRDLWNIDDWFMSVMPDMLKEFKAGKHGAPCCLGTEYLNEDGILCNDTCHEEWDRILDEMIYWFQEMNEETCQRKNEYNIDDVQYYDKERELETYRELCKEKGFLLFSKWFYHLWD